MARVLLIMSIVLQLWSSVWSMASCVILAQADVHGPRRRVTIAGSLGFFCCACGYLIMGGRRFTALVISCNTILDTVDRVALPTTISVLLAIGSVCMTYFSYLAVRTMINAGTNRDV